MPSTKSISSNYTDDGMAGTIAAIRNVRQEFEDDIEELTAGCDVLARAERLIADHHGRARRSSDLHRNGKKTVIPDRDVSPSDSGSPTGLRKAVCALAECLPAKFTAPDVLAHLQAQGFNFAGNPMAAVRDALYSLSRAAEPMFRLTQAGKGGKHNVYTNVIKSESA